MFCFKPIQQQALFLLFFCLYFSCTSQTYFYGEGPINWELRKPYELPAEAEKYAASDLVILNDLAEFYFCSSTNEKLVRTIKYKINTQRGLDLLKHYKMPDSFDHAFDGEIYQQGRRARIKIPNIRELKINVFAARKFSRQRWSNVTVKDRYETLRWIKTTGEFSDESMTVFDLGTIAIGDVVEIYYEVYFNAQYGANMFYPAGPYPKLACEYDFIYRSDKPSAEASFILPVNIDSTKIYTSKVTYEGHFLFTTKMQFSDLAANTYPLNSFESVKQPHVYADFSYYRSMVSYLNKQYAFTKTVKPRNYEWAITPDTTVKEQVRIYDKQSASIKKFASTLPPPGSDSQNVVFLRALCDTFNHFRYASPNQLYYNESNLYELSNGDHLLKRRLVGHTMWKLYTDILRENKVFYYLVNIQDKRFGEHTNKSRSHFAYEHTLLALPAHNTYAYFMPRNEGLKYHPDELPFYYEDAMAALAPMNFQRGQNNETKAFKLVKTKASTFDENRRVEDLDVKISIDSLIVRMGIKESLSGQFSTLLRPLYLNEVVDSTIAPHYFKKCTDKPGLTAKKIKLSSKSAVFPFQYRFDCSGKISFKDTNKLSIQDWFSFVLSKKVIPGQPNYAYYFDFVSTDSYNVNIDFNKPVDIRNREAFARKIINAFFELQSELVKNTETSYSLKIRAVIKEHSIPVDKANLLAEFVKQLDQLNNFSLELSKH